MTNATSGTDDLALLDDLARAHKQLVAQIARRIVGQHAVVDNIVAALLSGGHALLVGVPGLAKTLLVRTVAEALDLSFSRVQFTPDLMPSDITGTEMLEEDHATGRRSFKYVQGPIFANAVLADEINRAPPKTQAALLQAMQEHAVTASGQTHALPEPFFVLATQNPIEQEAYPLPRAGSILHVQPRIGYPTLEEEGASRLNGNHWRRPLQSSPCSPRRSSRSCSISCQTSGRQRVTRYAKGRARALHAPRHARGRRMYWNAAGWERPPRVAVPRARQGPGAAMDNAARLIDDVRS